MSGPQVNTVLCPSARHHRPGNACWGVYVCPYSSMMHVGMLWSHSELTPGQQPMTLHRLRTMQWSNSIHSRSCADLLQPSRAARTLPARSAVQYHHCCRCINMALDVGVSRDQTQRQPLETDRLLTSLHNKKAAISRNVQELRELAEDVAHSDTSGQRWKNLKQMLSVALTGEPARMLARFMICSYYINVVFAEIEAWQRAGRLPGPPPGMAANSTAAGSRFSATFEAPFPWLHVFGLLPAAVLAALGLVAPWLFAGLLFVFTLWQDARYVLHQVIGVVTWRQSPTEILMRVVAMAGGTALMALYSARESDTVRRYAGLLLGADARPRSPRAGRAKSLGLLLARLMVAALLVWAGVAQMRRINARLNAASYTKGAHHYGRPEPHDNNWMLLEMLLGIFLAFGLFVTPVTRLLCLVLLLEAAAVWRWWSGPAPNWAYRAHMREHFFLNIAMSGGLLLLQSFGPGMFSADALLMKQD